MLSAFPPCHSCSLMALPLAHERVMKGSYNYDTLAVDEGAKISAVEANGNVIFLGPFHDQRTTVRGSDNT